MSSRIRLFYALGLVTAYVLLAATHWLGGANVAYELFYRLIAFVAVGVVAPLVWISLSRVPSEPGASVYRQLLVAVAVAFAVFFLFPELAAPAGWVDVWAGVSNAVAGAGVAYFAYRFLPVFLDSGGLTGRIVWGVLAVLAVVPTTRGVVSAGLAGMLTWAAGSFWPAAVLFTALFTTFDCGLSVEGVSSTGPWLIASLAVLVPLVLVTLRGAPAHKSREQDEADALYDVDREVDEHQRQRGVVILPHQPGQEEAADEERRGQDE
ncbi:MAG: hypothetical protein A2Y64_04600 [Candidatus Coatesbacteria bacterium RBG_13_66_14]|uniref:Uncharacterized protein n=1 Tax=Candidatus Coatesbacteria bacterium RBG_13_66_14 TaxID=1817816 RepID=A0A1F5FB19_9BACT|nr:MAG: hypothetical protein A2Y64_04600 [Candidatus Coatesbacteria bacterium RBG_13_66_14]